VLQVADLPFDSDRLCSTNNQAFHFTEIFGKIRFVTTAGHSVFILALHWFRANKYWLLLKIDSGNLQPV
jgi:hypothetical protein